MRRNKGMPLNGDAGRTMGHRNGRNAYAPGRDILGYLLPGISVVLLGRSLMLCFSNDIWYDELFTVGMIGHSYGELVELTAQLYGAGCAPAAVLYDHQVLRGLM